MATFYPYGVTTDTEDRGHVIVHRCMTIKSAEDAYRGLGCPGWAHVVALYQDGSIARELERPVRQARRRRAA